MPFEVSNPVKFYAGGDTTSQAIKKHIDEFLRVYSILNNLGTGKAAIVTSPNTVLKNGEIGVMLSPWALKVGNGVSKWYQLQGASVVEIIDNLLSESPDKALSAKQGKALKELIDAIHIPEIVDDLTTGGSGKALSAEQGKALKALIDTLTTPVPGPPGPKGIEWRGAWDGTAEYRKDDAVSYRGGSFIALKPSTGERPTSAEYWGVLSAKGADGTGAGDMTKAVYDPDGDGKVDAAVVADTANAVAWDDVTGKPEKFTCDIVDALDSDRADAALSAKQGKTLKTLIDAVPQVEIVDDLTTGGANKALSAEQGKALKALIDTGGGSGITAAQLAAAIATGKWTERTMPRGDWYAVCWSPERGLFCAVGFKSGNGSAATSPDGITWTERTIPAGEWRAVCWSPERGLFCAVGSNGRAATSPDGKNWTERTIPSGSWRSVCWSSTLGLFCAVSGNGSAATSPDGITWTERTIIPSGSWWSVCWSSTLGLFCAVSDDGNAATSFPLKL